MSFYQLDYVVEEVKKNEPSREQSNLKTLVGREFDQQEAEFVWERVNDHKWYLGERLKRDVGTRVAAIDYVENFYESKTVGKNSQTDAVQKIIRSFANLGRAFFVSKSRIIT